MFARLQWTLLIHDPIMTQDEMARHMERFNEMFGFRVESCDGTLDILTDTWKAANCALDSQTGTTQEAGRGGVEVYAPLFIVGAG